MKTTKEIGVGLKELRSKSGFTQEAIAKFLDMDQSNISKIENGERPISTDMLEKLMSLYGYPMAAMEKNGLPIAPLRVCFRTDSVTADDLNAICAINKVALNSIFMEEQLESEYGQD